jgi:hypothetical protein
MSDNQQQLAQQVELELQRQYSLSLSKNNWVRFDEVRPMYGGMYIVCISTESNVYVECAEFMKSRNQFVLYSRRGYPYVINASHWRELPELPLSSTNGDKNESIS